MNTYLLDKDGHLYEADARDVVALCGHENPAIGPDNTVTVSDEQLDWETFQICPTCYSEAEFDRAVTEAEAKYDEEPAS